MRKVIFLLVLAVLAVAAAPGASAAEHYGSVQVKLEAGDLAVTNGAVTLYQVGVRTEEGFRITEGFGGGIIRQADADSRQLARWLAESADQSGLTRLLDADGNALFTELEEGLYLLVQTERMDGFYPIQPVLLELPQEKNWDLNIRREPAPVVTEIPKTGQTPVPILGVLGMALSAAGLILSVRKCRKR